MRNRFAIYVLLLGAGLVFSGSMSAQSGPGSRALKTAAASALSEHDLSGVWNAHPPASAKAYINTTFTKDEPELTPWGREKFNETKPSNGRGPRAHTLEQTNDPVVKSCLPPGTPRIYLQPFPMQIVQTPKEMIMLFEYDHTVRYIFMDGRKHPDDLTPTYMGHSIGYWEGDTLVVDTIGFNDRTWLDRAGHVHSDQLHVIERFRRPDHDNLQIDIEMEDPKALAKPWTTQLFYRLEPEWDIMELACTDNVSFLGFEK